MELNLKTVSVGGYERVFTQQLRKEETVDSVVPDTLPDIREILSVSGNVMIRSKDVGEGRLSLEANIPAKITYIPEGEEQLCVLEVNLPLYAALEDGTIPENGLCVTDLKLSALDARMLNPRKITLRAEVVFCVDCYTPSEAQRLALPEEPAEGVNLLERRIPVTQVCDVTEKTFVLTDAFTLPPAAYVPDRLLSQSTQLQIEEIKTVGKKLVVKGSAKSALLCAAEGTAPVPVTFATGFSQILEVSELPEDAFFRVCALLSGAYYDLPAKEGDEGSMELHVVLQAVVYGRDEAVCLTDAYSNRYGIETASQPETFRRIVRSVTLRETLREQLPTQKSVAEVLQGSWEAGAPQVSGGETALPVTLSACFRAADGSLGRTKHSFQLRFRTDLEAGQTPEPVEITAQELFLAPSAGGVEVRLPVELSAFVWEEETVDTLTAVSYDETARADLSERPSLVILKVSSGDDLWLLAKENASTVEAIREANALSGLVPPWEKLLLIPKMS